MNKTNIDTTFQGACGYQVKGSQLRVKNLVRLHMKFCDMCRDTKTEDAVEEVNIHPQIHNRKMNKFFKIGYFNFHYFFFWYFSKSVSDSFFTGLPVVSNFLAAVFAFFILLTNLSHSF